MKKTFYRILLTAAILPTVGPGCVNEEREHHDPVVPLAFEPVMHAQVRAGETPDNTGDTGNNSFGVSAWTLDRNETWSTGSENAEPFLDREKLLRDGVFWYPESKPDWPPLSIQPRLHRIRTLRCRRPMRQLPGSRLRRCRHLDRPRRPALYPAAGQSVQKPERRRHLAPDDPRPLRSQLPRERRLRV